MSVTFYIISTLTVFIFSGLLAMAGLGAAFLFVPLFYYMGMPLAEATPRLCCSTWSACCLRPSITGAAN